MKTVPSRWPLQVTYVLQYNLFGLDIYLSNLMLTRGTKKNNSDNPNPEFMNMDKEMVDYGPNCHPKVSRLM